MEFEGPLNVDEYKNKYKNLVYKKKKEEITNIDDKIEYIKKEGPKDLK